MSKELEWVDCTSVLLTVSGVRTAAVISVLSSARGIAVPSCMKRLSALGWQRLWLDLEYDLWSSGPYKSTEILLRTTHRIYSHIDSVAEGERSKRGIVFSFV